jgi:hypothetical protein
MTISHLIQDRIHGPGTEFSRSAHAMVSLKLARVWRRMERAVWNNGREHPFKGWVGPRGVGLQGPRSNEGLAPTHVLAAFKNARRAPRRLLGRGSTHGVAHIRIRGGNTRRRQRCRSSSPLRIDCAVPTKHSRRRIRMASRSNASKLVRPPKDDGSLKGGIYDGCSLMGQGTAARL